MKRSTSVILAMTGTAALAGYMATRPPKCDPNEAWRTEPCPASSSSSSSSSSRRSVYYSSGSSTASTPQTAAARGGFGSTGHAMSSAS